MKRIALLSAVAALALAGCPSDPAPSNPEQLWLTLDGSELRIKLVPVEPNPF